MHKSARQVSYTIVHKVRTEVIMRSKHQAHVIAASAKCTKAMVWSKMCASPMHLGSFCNDLELRDDTRLSPLDALKSDSWTVMTECMHCHLFTHTVAAISACLVTFAAMTCCSRSHVGHTFMHMPDICQVPSLLHSDAATAKSK